MKFIDGLSEVASEVDGLILDLWGLVHDGVTAYPGVTDTFSEIGRAGIKTILLSNAPRRSYTLVDSMEVMGIERGLYGDIFSSGEATWQELKSRTSDVFKDLGDKAFHIGPERDVSVLEETGIQRVDKIESGEFLLNTGPVDVTDSLEQYETILIEARQRGLPMVCANPDEVVIRDGQRVICAGAIARRYEALGGHAVYRGKPDPAVYHLAIDRLGIPDPSRVAVVGDALETDVAGAAAAGLKSVWCTGGIHADALGTKYGTPADQNRAEQLASDHGYEPWAVIPGFSW